MNDKTSLSIYGGEPVRRNQTPSWPIFEQDEIDSVVACLVSGEVNQWTGVDVDTFESEFGEYLGPNYAIAVSNGTVGLELALEALDTNNTDEVIVPSRTFVATASAVHRVGAKPVVVDIEADSGNIHPEAIQDAITDRTKAIIPVHTLGWPCQMDVITELAEDHGLYIIEDCAQAHGAKFNDQFVGTFGDINCFSFCQDKIMTTGGEGGMVVTDDEELWRKAWELKDHGKNYDKATGESSGPGLEFVHDSFGTNWRLSGPQAAIGRKQLEKLDDWLEIRARNAHILIDAFEDIPGISIPVPDDHIDHAWYKVQAQLDLDQLSEDWSRDLILEAIQAEGVPCYEGLCSEIYREKAFERHGLGPDTRLPNAKVFGERSLMFLVHPTLSAADMRDVAAATNKVLEVATSE